MNHSTMAQYIGHFLGLAVVLSACNGMFFQPDDLIYHDPQRSGQKVSEFLVESTDGVALHTWIFGANEQPARGVILQFHGNAQNMTAHAGYASWLADFGYHVVTFDYRGYGQSLGSPSREGAIQDGVKILSWISQQPDLAGLPIIVLGQSLGGALAIASIAQSKIKPQILILDSTFSSYRGVAITMLRGHWLTWSFQWLPWLLISDEFAPVSLVEQVSGFYLFVHSRADFAVPISTVYDLYEKAPPSKSMWVLEEPGHIMAFAPESPYRLKLVEFLNLQINSP